jgi:hypothetical protein
MTCRFKSGLFVLLLIVASASYAGHAGEMESPSVMPHELMAGLVGLAGLLLITIAALVWIVWRLRKLDQRLRALEGGRRG